MKKFILLLLVNIFILNVTAKVQHGKEHDLMIMSLPRSGSTFLIRALKKSLSIQERCWEKFNKCFMEPKTSDMQKRKCGQLYGLVVQKLPHAHLKQEYDFYWKNCNYNITKEVYTIFNIDFFEKMFQVIGLYRHRHHTFPSSQTHYFTMFYEAFEKIPQECPYLQRVQSFLSQKKLTPLEKQCATHIIFNYVLLSKCAQYNLPVIDYEKLITLNQNALYNYLKKKLPPKAFKDSLPEAIKNLRDKLEDDFLNKRILQYQALSLEPFCRELIAFIKNLDPDMPYWQLLE